MNIIAHLLQNLKNLNTNIFLFLFKLQPLLLNNASSKDLELLIENPEIDDLIRQLITNSDELNNLLSPISSTSKKDASIKKYPFPPLC